MTNQIFTSTGCARCKITKTYMQANNIEYEEFDIKAEGKDVFAQFYRHNRSAIFRDKDGVEFPVFTDGNSIYQGVGRIIGYLKAGNTLDSFISHSQLHGEWIDGFSIHEMDTSQADNFLFVLSYLIKHGLNVELRTTGDNSNLLKRIIDEKLAQRLIMEVKAPKQLYSQLCGHQVDVDEIGRSIKMAVQFPEYRFFTKITPFQRASEMIEYFTPEEIGQIAQWIETETGSKKQDYKLTTWTHEDKIDDRLKTLDQPSNAQMFKYRTAAKRFQVMADFEK